MNFDRSTAWRGLDREEQNRQEAILEVIESEGRYYKRLETLYEVYYHESSSLISQTDRSVIFQNLDELLLRSALFLTDLRCRQKEDQFRVHSICDTFLTHVLNPVM